MSTERRLETLLRERSRRFAREIRPYVFYALQSGTMAFALLFMAGLFVYQQLLAEAPPGFPFALLASVALMAALSRVSIRTYLKEADQLYLLPLESEMQGCIRQALKRAYIRQAFLLTAVLAAVWPMIRATDAQAGWRKFAVLLVMLLLLLGSQLHARWTELSQSEESVRRWLTALRWIVSWASAYFLVAFPLWLGVFIVAAGTAGYVLLLRFVPGQKTIPWLALIAEERRQQAAMFRFLNQFVDVPSLRSKPRALPAPPRLAEWLGFRPQRTYVFVYFLVWLRSEWFGISLRLTAIGVFLVAISGGGLSALLLFALFAVLIAMQLKELEGVYRNYEWTRMYPLPTGLRDSSVRLVRFVLHAAAVVALAVPLGWHAIHGDLWAGLLADGVLFAGVVVGSVAGSFLYHRLRKAG